MAMFSAFGLCDKTWSYSNIIRDQSSMTRFNPTDQLAVLTQLKLTQPNPVKPPNPTQSNVTQYNYSN